mmetsp:Transcript_45235/g.148344  ORF Transcript_45235/g.148344 Transcript_45235/m.148344 type:complete len:285 (+) Transcript_45235:187-1041(+)
MKKPPRGQRRAHQKRSSLESSLSEHSSPCVYPWPYAGAVACRASSHAEVVADSARCFASHAACAFCRTRCAGDTGGAASRRRERWVCCDSHAGLAPEPAPCAGGNCLASHATAALAASAALAALSDVSALAPASSCSAASSSSRNRRTSSALLPKASPSPAPPPRRADVSALSSRCCSVRSLRSSLSRSPCSRFSPPSSWAKRRASAAESRRESASSRARASAASFLAASLCAFSSARAASRKATLACSAPPFAAAASSRFRAHAGTGVSAVRGPPRPVVAAGL